MKLSRLNACLFFSFNLLFVRGFLKMPSYFQEIFNDPPVFLISSKSERDKLQVVKSCFQQLQRLFYLFSYIVFPTAHSLAALSSLSKISLSSPFLAWISGYSTARVFLPKNFFLPCSSNKYFAKGTHPLKTCLLIVAIMPHPRRVFFSHL